VLVAQREAEGEDATEASPPSDEPESHPASRDINKSGAGQANVTEQQEVRTKKLVQRPVYFVSSLLQGARTRYSGVQKLLFGLLMASRKLRHYFQAHQITVVTRFTM
jgi:hypothetical protein